MIGQESSCLAVVDIGSNTVKLSVYRCGAEGPVALVHDADTVRIGFRVSETGEIAADRVDRLITCLKRYAGTAREHGADRFIGVATQAFRIARNASDVIDRIGRETPWRIRVIDAAEETRLTIEGARPWIPAVTRTVVADIGGASTELIMVAANGSVEWGGSLPVGSGLLFDEEIAASPPPPGSMERARDRVASILDDASTPPRPADLILLPGGTGHFLRLLLDSLDPVGSFTPRSLPVLHEWLSSRPATETMTRIPVQLERAQVLPASLAIVEALVLRLDPSEIRAVPSGIRDGVARTACPSR